MDEELKTGYLAIDAVLSVMARGVAPSAPSLDFMMLQAVKNDFRRVSRSLVRLAREGLQAERVAEAAVRFADAVRDAAGAVSESVLRTERKGAADGKR